MPVTKRKMMMGEVYGNILLALMMFTITALTFAPVVWLILHVYAWALGI